MACVLPSRSFEFSPLILPKAIGFWSGHLWRTFWTFIMGSWVHEIFDTYFRNKGVFEYVYFLFLFWSEKSHVQLLKVCFETPYIMKRFERFENWIWDFGTFRVYQICKLILWAIFKCCIHVRGKSLVLT